MEQGFTGGYKLVNRWLSARREKPGRKHSLREKDLLGLVTEEETGTSSPQPQHVETDEAIQPVTLEAPRHLVWLLLRDASSLDIKEQRTLAFIRQHPLVETLYDLIQSYGKLFNSSIQQWTRRGTSESFEVCQALHVWLWEL